MNYSQLCAAVSDTVENSFTAADLERFARLTEQKVYQFIRLPVQQKTYTGNLTANNANLTLPAGFLNPLSLAVVVSGSYQYLLFKDVSYVREAYPSPTVTGVPKVYAIPDNTKLFLGPTPNSAYAVDLQYEAYPESIVTAGTTWLGDNYDSVLFNGMLVEAGRFLRLEQETVAQYDKMFQESLAQLKQLGDAKLRQDIYRSGQAHAAVI
jgi:hypothetical protein